jgi:hypothetical protein
MTRPTPPRDEDTTAADAALKRAVLDLPALQADTEALSARVLAQWQASHAAGGAVGPRPAAALALRLRRHPLIVGVAGLAAVAAIASAVLLLRPDPALDELMQPDVLSQMAAGEM